MSHVRRLEEDRTYTTVWAAARTNGFLQKSQIRREKSGGTMRNVLDKAKWISLIRELHESCTATRELSTIVPYE